MAVATQRDLEFVIKVRDRSRDGFAAATVSVKQLTNASKIAGTEFDHLRTKTTALGAAVAKLRDIWVAAAGVMSRVALVSGASQFTQSYSHFGAMLNSISFGLINVAAKANILPPRLNRALDALNLFLNGNDKLRASLTALSKHDNFWVRLFGSTALPIAQTTAVGGLIAAFRVLAGVERQLAGGGVLFGPMIPYLEGLNRMFRGRLTEGVRKATDNFWGFGRALQWAATIMEVVKHPLTRLVIVFGSLAAAMASLNTIQQFERALYRTASVAGVPVQFLSRVSQEIRRIGIEYGITATELTGAFERIAGAGYQGAEAFDILRAAAMAAQFGMGTVVQTQDVLTSIMAVYGDEVDGAQDALGMLLSAIREGKADADQFGASFGRVFGVARQAGLSLQELLSAVTVLSRTGLPAAEGVAAVRQAIGDLTAPSRQAMNIMRDLNISVEAVQRSLRERGLVETARDMLDVLNNATWTDQQGNVLAGNQLIARIFDQVEGRNAVLQWYDSLRDATDEVMQRVGETPATLARDVWADMQDSVALAFDRFKALLHDFQIGLGNAIAGPITGVMNFFTQNIEAISIALKLIFVNIVMQIADWFIASRFVNGFFVLLSRFLGGLKILGFNVGVLWKGLGALGARMLKVFTTPLNIGAIVNALRNVVFSFRTAMLRVREVAGQTREYMRLAMLNPALALRMAATAARGAAMRLGSMIASGFNAGFKAVKFGLTWFIGNLMDWFWTIQIFGEMWDAPFKVMGETVKLASVSEGTFQTLGVILGDLWQGGKAAVIEWYNSNKHYIDEFVAAVVQIGTMLAPVVQYVGNMLEGTFKALPAAFSVVISGFQMIWNAIKETMEFFSALWRAIVGTWNAIGDAINQVLEDIGWSGFWRDAQTFFASVGDMAGGLVDVFSTMFNILEIKFDAWWAKMGKKVDDFVSTINPGSYIARRLNDLFGGARVSPEEETQRRIAAENERLRQQLQGNSGLGGTINRVWRDSFAGVDFSETRREFRELRDAASTVGTAYREAFNNDNAAPSPAQAARGYAQTWLNNVLAAERRRRAADNYVNGTNTSDPRGGVPDLSLETATDPISEGNSRDPYVTTLTRLRESIEETHRMAKANEMFNAVKSAGLELQWRAIEAGHSELVSRQDLLRVAELQGLVEVADQRAREMRIEDLQLQAEEARRVVEVMQRIRDPNQRAAELAALQTEISLRRERRDITEEELAAARQASLDNSRFNQARDLIQNTEQVRAETDAIRAQMAIRYQSGQQYAVDNAVLTERNRLLAKGVDLLTAETQAYLASVAERAAAEYQQQNRSLNFVDSIRQRADEAMRQLGTLQSTIADGVMRLGDGIVDQLWQMAETGRASFGEMTAAILADIAKMIAKMAIMRLMSSFFGGGGLKVPAIAPSAHGNVFDGVRRFAKGGAFANSIVNSATMFKYGNGALGVMGEAGKPEGVFPLTRMPNGNLGVEARGSGGVQNNITFAPSIVVNAPPSTGNAQMDMDQARLIAKAVSDAVDHRIAQFEQAQYRSSNRLSGQLRRPI